MSRNALNFLVDCTLLIAFLTLIWIAILIRSIFPPGTTAIGWSVWGLGYDAWAKLEFVVLLVFATCVLIHLILHWTWVCGFIAARVSHLVGRRMTTNESTRTAYGVTTLIAILSTLGFLLFLAQIKTRSPDKREAKNFKRPDPEVTRANP